RGPAIASQSAGSARCCAGGSAVWCTGNAGTAGTTAGGAGGLGCDGGAARGSRLSPRGMPVSPVCPGVGTAGGCEEDGGGGDGCSRRCGRCSGGFPTTMLEYTGTG